MRLAIIDNEISAATVQEFAGKEICCYELRENGFQPIRDQELHSRSHGTVCAALVAEFVSDAELIELSILGGQRELLVEHVCTAFKWCLEQRVDCLCLSLGTIQRSVCSFIKREWRNVRIEPDVSFECGKINTEK